jgi:hypothetical protein
MRQKLAICFGILAIVSVLVWVAGILAGAVIPLFGGVRTETVGGIGLTIALTAEFCLYLFGWLSQRLKLNSEEKSKGFPGKK